MFAKVSQDVKCFSVGQRFMSRPISASSRRAPPASVEKVRNIITFLLETEDVQELRDFPHWNAHQLTGDSKGRGA